MANERKALWSRKRTIYCVYCGHREAAPEPLNYLRSGSQIPPWETMNRVPPIIVIFVCPQCGAGYQTTQRPQTLGASGRFKCEFCQTDVYAWSGPYTYLDWQTVETFT